MSARRGEGDKSRRSPPFPIGKIYLYMGGIFLYFFTLQWALIFSMWVFFWTFSTYENFCGRSCLNKLFFTIAHLYQWVKGSLNSITGSCICRFNLCHIFWMQQRLTYVQTRTCTRHALLDIIFHLFFHLLQILEHHIQ